MSNVEYGSSGQLATPLFPSLLFSNLFQTQGRKQAAPSWHDDYALYGRFKPVLWSYMVLLD
jgi:hypothetical protein